MANEEPLRRTLRNRFRDHQVEPPPDLEKTILSKVALSRPWWQSVTAKAALGVGVLLVGGVVWWLNLINSSQEGFTPLHTLSPKTTPASPLISAPRRSTSVKTDQLASNGLSGQVSNAHKQHAATNAGNSLPADSSLLSDTPSGPEILEPALSTARPAAKTLSSTRKKNTHPRAVLVGSLKTDNRHRWTMRVRNRLLRSTAFPMDAENTRRQPTKSVAEFTPVQTVPSAVLNQAVYTQNLLPKPVRIPETHWKTPVIFLPARSELTHPTRQTHSALLPEAGIVAGSQLVASPGTQRSPGWSAGIWGGVTFSPKLSVETGLTASHPLVMTHQESNSPVMIDSVLSRQLMNQSQTWWNLTIPLLVRYQIRAAGRWRWSLAAGVSSAIVINDRQINEYTFTKRQNATDTTGQSGVTQVLVVQTGPSMLLEPFRWFTISSSVEFAHVGRHKLSLEPYFSYPIGGITSQSVRVGMAGLQLRLKLRSRPPVHSSHFNNR